MYKREKTKLLLINFSHKGRYIHDTAYGCSHVGKYIKYSWPPLNLYHIAGFVKNSVVLDENIKPFSFSILKNYNPKFVLLYTSYISFKEDLGAINKTKECCPNAKIIVCGDLPTLEPKKILMYDNIDFVIRGEAEQIINDLVNGGSNLPGLCYKSHISQKIIRLDDLNTLPTPNIPLNILKQYRNPFAINYPVITLTISRGCPYSCSFCTAPLLTGKKIRLKKVDTIIGEIKFYLNQGIKEIFLRDENISVNKQFLKRLCNRICREKLKFSWICNSRVDTLDQECLRLMILAGCHLIKFGCESGSDEILKKLKKGITTKKIVEAFRNCDKLGIKTLAHFIIGNHGETKKTLEMTKKLIKKIKPYYLSLDKLRVYPKTSICNKKITNLSREYINREYNKIFRAFYLNPLLILRHIFASRTKEEFKLKFYSTLQLWNSFMKV